MFDPDWLDAFAKIFAPLGTVAGGVALYMMKRTINKIDSTSADLGAHKIDSERRINQVDANLKDYKLEAQRTFAVEANIQASLGRLHGKVENLEEKFDDTSAELGAKIDQGVATMNTGVQSILTLMIAQGGRKPE